MRQKLLALVAVPLLALTACGSETQKTREAAPEVTVPQEPTAAEQEETNPDPAPSAEEPTAIEQDNPQSEPEQPNPQPATDAEQMAQMEEDAKAFAVHAMEVLARMHQTRDTAELLSIAAPDCEICISTAENFERYWADGYFLEITDLSIEPVSATCDIVGYCSVDINIDWGSYYEVDPDGNRQEILEAVKESSVTVRYLDGDLLLVDW